MMCVRTSEQLFSRTAWVCCLACLSLKAKKSHVFLERKSNKSFSQVEMKADKYFCLVKMEVNKCFSL